jgi:hypothetical protein
MFGNPRNRVLAVIAGAAALTIPACAPSSSGGNNALDLSGTCTPGGVGQFQLLPGGNTGTLHIETLPGGGLSVTCEPGSTTSTTSTTVPESTSSTESTTTTSVPESTTSTESTTTTSTPDTSTTTVPDTTTTTLSDTTTTTSSSV